MYIRSNFCSSIFVTKDLEFLYLNQRPKSKFGPHGSKFLIRCY